MEIILTHEQADFDALASLLGAQLLDDNAVPVLPRRMNRNVKAFLTLYGLEFPFLDPRDLPKTKIKRVTLVDTQSMVTLKGMDSQTEVYVLDHHPLRPDIPENWQITTEDIGATTTLLVEAIQNRGLSLSIHQATLLLLGIYEDTGKLTYTRTTPRDARATAFLLEQGASLDLMQDFLNHPLSHTQQAIYDQLRQDIRTLTIHGNTIMLGQANARHTDEELSTLAHKLRDLLDPDAIFLLVDTKGGTQLVARSTTDLVNVGKIAEQFGGGGHQRAAAALVREQNPAQVTAELETLLPEYVKPAVTVAEIMSRRPQLLTPETPVGKAAEQMRRYGYEGYPVVENGTLVGLLTRRAVDRTLNHRLNLNVGDVMDAGQVTISPEAPLENLQQLMTDTGWGQIPVVVDDKIIGIVTRTDLIKTLTPKDASSSKKNLAGKLEASLSPARQALLRAVAEEAQNQGIALYIVGGFVRDLLLDRPSLDLDLVVEGDAIALGQALTKKYGGRTNTHRRFGTAKWSIENIRDKLAQTLGKASDQTLNPDDFPETLDLVSARREFYTHPTALPTVERGSIKLDLHRRDFTINTLALRLDGSHYGQLHDYWGGLADLNAHRVRVLHSLSFVDDPTRILRAVRFEQRFGYQIGSRTLELLQNALPLLDRVSGDRLRHELDHMLQEPNWREMLRRMGELGVLEAIHPKITWNQEIERRIEKGIQAAPLQAWQITTTQNGYPLLLAMAYLSWWISLDADAAAEVAARLKLPGWLADTLQNTILLWQSQEQLKTQTTSETVTQFENLPGLALLACAQLSPDADVRQKITDYFAHWQLIQPYTTGHDLRALEIPPGPQYARILSELRAAWLDRRLKTRADEKDLLETLLDEHFPDR